MSNERKGRLTDEQAFSPQGCGAGTENACFPLTTGPDGFECLLVTNPQVAGTIGITRKWRVNVDESDQKAWCPLGVLDNSKTS